MQTSTTDFSSTATGRSWLHCWLEVRPSTNWGRLSALVDSPPHLTPPRSAEHLSATVFARNYQWVIRCGANSPTTTAAAYSLHLHLPPRHHLHCDGQRSFCGYLFGDVGARAHPKDLASLYRLATYRWGTYSFSGTTRGCTHHENDVNTSATSTYPRPHNYSDKSCTVYFLLRNFTCSTLWKCYRAVPRLSLAAHGYFRLLSRYPALVPAHPGIDLLHLIRAVAR